jgi:alkylhydroperoxidase/carboxymuconolactone decarboxylase family protein YurZ
MNHTADTPTPITDQLRALGEWNPAWEPFAELDPGWTERFMAMATRPMLSGVLDPKTVEFIAIAVDASCTHLYGPGVRRHIRKALDLGATRDEITAVLQLTSVLGIHTMSVGAPMLLEELAARRDVAPIATP